MPCMGRGAACMICPPLWGCCMQGPRSRPCFCSNTSEAAVGFFLSFCIFLSIICPNGPRTQLLLVPHSFFVFCCSREGDVCPGASSAAEGPRPLVPGCLCCRKDRCIIRRTRMCPETGVQRQAQLIVNKDIKVIPWERTVCSVNGTGKKMDNMWEGNEGPRLLSIIHPRLQNCRT